MPKILQYRLNLPAPILWSVESVKGSGLLVYPTPLKSIPRFVAVHNYTTIRVPDGWVVKFNRVPSTISITYFYDNDILHYHIENLDEFPTKVGIALVEDQKKYAELIADRQDETLIKYHILRSSIPEATNELLTIEQAAEFLKVKVATLYNWNSSGKLKAIKVGRSVKYYQNDLISFAQEKKK